MPPKRSYENAKTRRITSWLRSTRPRTGRRANVSSVRRKRAASRMGRSRRGARGRISSYRKRSKGNSSFQKLTRILAPVNSYNFTVAGRAEVPAPGDLSDAPCKWFAPTRAADFTLGYPNIIDVTSLAYYLNQRSRDSAFTSAVDLHSLDMKFISRDYSQTTKIVNQCNTQCIIEYHVIEARRDIPFRFNASKGAYNLLDFLGAGLYQTAVEDASLTGISSSDPVATAGAFANNDALLSSSYSIFNTGPFLHYFKVKKVQKVVMNAGDVKLFTMSRKAAITHRPALYSKLDIGTETWLYDTNSPFISFLKGTMFQLFKLTGTPINDRDTKGNVNLSSPAVDYFTTCRQKYQSVVRTGGVNHRGPSYGIGATPNPQFMGEQTDSPLTVTNA